MPHPRLLLIKNSGERVEHKSVRSLILVSSPLKGEEDEKFGERGKVQVDLDVLNAPICITMVGELLVKLEEEAGGEYIVAEAINFYAAATGKRYHRVRDITAFRSNKKRRI